MKRICKNCGTELPDGATHCVICGEKYVDMENSVSSGGEKSDGKEDGGKSFVPIMIALIGVALVIGGVGASRVLKTKKQIEEPLKLETADKESEKEKPVEEEPAEKEPIKEEQAEEKPAIEEKAEEKPAIEEKAEEEAAIEELAEEESSVKPEEEQEENHPVPRNLPENSFVYNGHTYGFYDASRYRFDDYGDVVDFCREQGGYLAVINNQAENNKLFDYVSENYEKTAFFGYSDRFHEGNWVWEEDGSNFENWTVIGQHQPDNGSGYGGDEDYAEFNYERGTLSPNDGTWNDAPFRDNTDTFVCEWDYEF